MVYRVRYAECIGRYTEQKGDGFVIPGFQFKIVFYGEIVIMPYDHSLNNFDTYKSGVFFTYQILDKPCSIYLGHE